MHCISPKFTNLKSRRSLNYQYNFPSAISSNRQIQRQSFDLNLSINFDRLNLNNDQLNDSLSQSSELDLKRSINLMTERSMEMGENGQNLMRQARKKMGIQLSILEKNILVQTNTNIKQKPKRLNKSSFIKPLITRKPQKQVLNQTQLISSKSSLFSSLTQSSSMNPSKNPLPSSFTSSYHSQQMTASNLQSLHKIDKNLYKLYMDLHADYKNQVDKEKENDRVIKELLEEIQREEENVRKYKEEINTTKEEQKEIQGRTLRSFLQILQVGAKGI